MIAPLLLALSLSAGVSGGADPVAPARVELDVVVTDARGRRVESLTLADFSVSERGQRLPIESVRFVGPPPPTIGPSAATPSVAGARLFAILLDEYHITAGPAAERTREALARFVRDDLGPDDSVVVLRPLDSLLTITLTTDRRAALEAIAAFAPRRSDYTARSAFEREFIAGAPANIEVARARITTSALNALTTHLGRFVSARKTLVVVSEGFVSQGIRRGEEFAPGLDTVAASANGANVTIYTVNPAGESTADSQSAEGRARDALRALASGTGGMNEDASTDPRAALLVARADASAHYVVTFASAQPGDGRLHPVEITVSRRDLTVRARKSYLTPIVAAVPRPSPPSFLSEYSARFPRRASTLIRPWFGMSRGETGKTMVSFVWEPAPRVPGERRPAVSPARIALSVTTLDGQPVYSGVVASATESLSAAGTAALASFEAPVGHLLVQMAIEDISAKVIDRDVRDLVVGGFRGPVSLGTAALSRARTAREQQELAANPDATPVASRQFSRSEHVLVRVPVFTDGAIPMVSAKLVSAFGSVMRDLPVALAPSRSDVYQFDISLASLAAGGYALEISAQTSEGSARDSISIRVTP